MILGSNLELTSHAILYYLWSADLSKSFPNSLRQYLSIFDIFFKRFYLVEKKCGVTNTLHEKCPNTELFLVRIFLYLDWIRRFTEQISVFSQSTGKYWPEITPYLDTLFFFEIICKVAFKFWAINTFELVFHLNICLVRRSVW